MYYHEIDKDTCNFYDAMTKEAKKDMPDFTEQDRPAKVKEIYKALKRDHPGMPAEMKARIAAKQGKPGKQKKGPPYKGELDSEYKKSDREKDKKRIKETTKADRESMSKEANVVGDLWRGVKGISQRILGKSGVGAGVGKTVERVIKSLADMKSDFLARPIAQQQAILAKARATTVDVTASPEKQNMAKEIMKILGGM